MNRIEKIEGLVLTISCFVLAAIIICLFSYGKTNVNENPKRLYTLLKSDDDNWSTSGKIDCDSFNFITNSHVEFFVDGRKSNLKGGMIKAYTNADYSPKK